MTDVTITVSDAWQGLVLLPGDGSVVKVHDTTPANVLSTLVDDPIARAVTVARLRAVAAILEAPAED